MSITDSQRQQIRDRAGDCCEYCRLPSSGSRLPFHVDHVRPRKHNGTDIAENLCLACYQCNGYKGTNIAGYDPQNDQITPLFNPRTQPWYDHFELEKDMTIRGLTPEGRTTVVVLRFNEDGAIQLRQVLAAMDEYPCVKSES